MRHNIININEEEKLLMMQPFAKAMNKKSLVEHYTSVCDVVYNYREKTKELEEELMKQNQTIELLHIQLEYLKNQTLANRKIKKEDFEYIRFLESRIRTLEEDTNND